MSEVWITKSLQEITTKIGSGATPRGGKKAYKTEGISLIRSLNVHDRSFRTKDLAFIDDKQADQLNNVVIEAGDVLLNITGASIARCCLVPSEFLPARVNQHVSIVRANQKQILPKFLCYLLTSKDYKDQLLDTGEKQGATRQALTKSLIQNFRVTYPESLSEQKRIVAILDEAFGAIARAKENAERNLTNSRELFDSYLNRVFTEKGEGWEESSLVDLCVNDRVITYGVIKLGDAIPDGVPCLRTSNVKKLKIDLSGMKRIAATLSESYGRTILQGNEVLVNVRGTLGGVSVVSEKMVGWNVSREVAVVPVNTETVDPQFVAFWVAAKNQQDWLTGVKKGAAYTGINIEDLRRLAVHFPNKQEQLKLVSKLESVKDSCRKIEMLHEQKNAALDELKQSLLQKAFTGQLTSKTKELELVP